MYLDNLPKVVDTSSPDEDTTSTSEILSNDISDGEKNIFDLSTINSQGKRVITKAVWEKVKHIRLDKIPYDINGLKHYVISDKERHKLLEKCRDGRKWERDSSTKWEGFNSVRYRDCHGGHYCPNNECNYGKEFDNVPNYLHFNDERCNICGATGIPVTCLARKYIAYKLDQAHIYHIGNHSCKAKNISHPVEHASKVLLTTPSATPSEIQTTAILSALRERKPWSDVKRKVAEVSNRKTISNEKIKQKKSLEPLGTSFDAVIRFKQIADEH